MTDWTHRVLRPPGPQELHNVRYAAMDLAHEAGRAPGKARIVFQTVADCALIGTVVISGVLASVHLFRALVPRNSEHGQTGLPEPAGNDRSPPRRPVSKLTAGDDPENDRPTRRFGRGRE